MPLASPHTFRKMRRLFDRSDTKNAWVAQPLIDQKANCGSPFFVRPAGRNNLE